MRRIFSGIRKKYLYSAPIDNWLCFIFVFSSIMSLGIISAILAYFFPTMMFLVIVSFFFLLLLKQMYAWWSYLSVKFIWNIPDENFTIIDNQISQIASFRNPQKLAMYIYHLIKNVPEQKMSGMKIMRMIDEPINFCIVEYGWSIDETTAYLEKIRELAQHLINEYKLSMVINVRVISNEEE